MLADLKDEEGRVYCGGCGIRDFRRNMTERHFKKSKCERSLLQRGSKLKGKPWREDWKDFIPEQYQGEVASNSDEVNTEEEKKEEVFQLKRTRTGKFLEIMNPY